MSVNIVINEKQPNLLLCSDYEKKEAVDRQRRLRLCQVREQSKEIAERVRKRVSDERRRQLEQIEKTKNSELERWRRKRLDNVQSIYSNCLTEVGQAHRNAAEEIEREKRLEERRQKAKIVSAKRGKDAAVRRAAQLKQLETNAGKPVKCHKNAQKEVAVSTGAENVIGKRAKTQISGETTSTLPPKSSRASTSGHQHKLSNIDASVDEIELTDTDGSGISLSDDESIDLLKKKWAQEKPSNYAEYMKMKDNNQTKPVSSQLLDSSDDSDDIVLSEEDKTDRINNTVKYKKQFSKRDVTPEKRYSVASSKNILETETPSPAFRQISDLLRKHKKSDYNKNATIPSTKQNITFSDKPKIPKSPNKFKSLQEPHSTGHISSLKATSDISHKTKTSKTSKSPQKVKYYDHDNRFNREYDQPKNIVSREDLTYLPFTRNAMDAAKDELILEEQRFKAVEELKKKDAIRAENAQKNELLRQEYELINQQFKEASENDPRRKKLLSVADQATQLLEHQKHMNNAFEEILRPTLITCPENPRKSQQHDSLRLVSSGLNIGRTNDQSTPDSSCSSIVLGYINGRAEEVAKNITQSKTSEKSEKLMLLKDLQQRINEKKILLNSEISRNQNDPKELDKILKSVSQLDKERIQIITGKQDRKKSAEINVGEAENVQEDHLQQLQPHERKAERRSKEKTKNVNIQIDPKSNAVQVMDESSGSSISGHNYPVQIVIKVNEGSYQSPRKRSTLIDSGSKRGKKKITLKSSDRLSAKVYPKTPVALSKTFQKSRQIKVADAQDESSTSTAYKNLPDHLPTDLAKAVDKNPSEKKNNPILQQYITRLLGMSRQSIDQLGVSSSTEVETPANSIINVSDNLAPSLDVDINRARRFVDENYSFLSQLEESLKESSSKPIEKPTQAKPRKDQNKIWIEKLKSVENSKDLELKKLRHELNELKRQKATEQKSKNVPSRPAQNSEAIAPRKPSSEVGLSQEDAIQRYSEITENCSKRISDLTDMIQKVRQEKLKLIETTLTSSDASGRNSTEYYELPPKPSAGNEEMPAGNLQQSKLIGFSRDSGIFSRPLTSQDDNMPHEFPEAPQKEVNSVESKSKPPPATFTRFSPQLYEQDGVAVHELSTIPEVETPGTSRINVSVNGSTEVKKENSVHYQKYPAYDEYIQQRKLDATQFDPDASTQNAQEIRKLMEVSTKSDDLLYKKFVGNERENESSAITIHEGDTLKNNKSQAASKTEDLKTDDNAIGYSKFPSFKIYAQHESDLLESRTLENVDLTTDIPDVEEELLRRKIISHPFSNNATITGGSDNTKENHYLNEESPVSGQERFKLPRSPRKKSRSKSMGTKSTTAEPDGNKENLSGIEALQSTSISILEDDLIKNNLKWASSMLKKSKEAQALVSSSESSVANNQAQQTADATDSSTSGRPINLSEFLNKELQKRNSSTSTSSIDESRIDSGYLRSLIYATNRSKSMTPQMGGTHQHTTQRTSTPVNNKSTSPSPDEMFSGESRISSVRYNSSHKTDSSGSTSNQERLVVPDVKLNVEKYGLSSTTSNSKSN